MQLTLYKVEITNLITKPFTLAILPDTQIYTESYPEIFTSQTQWIIDNIEKLNIAFVLHEGDIQNSNTEDQWQRAYSSMSLLDEKIPYAEKNNKIGTIIKIFVLSLCCIIFYDLRTTFSSS
mgnify:CR=1 FL=1